MCQALGMTTLIAARKGADHTDTDSRTPFTQVLAQSTVLVLCLPRNPETIDTISGPELQAMSTETILINVSRGGIVNEEALLKALKDGALAGCATDVYLREPSGAGKCWEEGDSPILNVSQAEAGAMNLLVTPHVAWYTKATVDSYLQTLQQNILCWLEGKPKNIVV
ncbi:hypothetical protein NQ176_g2066 [Zarea fungicola]|uniref:Uncharacterized protein n=1 Tax=Zarea fungicola TaxID=93591 RepID=A0ACC1NSP2_9HYPO|nr:hypothetical protein NQ176_g2066 [Lecanicillium fungicola]